MKKPGCKTPNGAECLIFEPWDHDDGWIPKHWYIQDVENRHLPKQYLDDMREREKNGLKKQTPLDWAIDKLGCKQ